MTSSASPGLSRLNAADGPAAAALLHAVCGSRTWSEAVAAGRPYTRLADLLTAGDAATAALTAADLDEAVAGHPPIGRPKPGDPESAREQRGVGDAERAELLRLNLAYQEAHGHVFLICATGLSGDQMLAALAERLENNEEMERTVATTELRKITRLRVAKELVL